MFKARQKDLRLNTNLQLQFARFVPLILEQEPHKLVLKEQGYGSHSAKALAKILKHNEQLTTLDVSMNNLHLNLDALISGLR